MTRLLVALVVAAVLAGLSYSGWRSWRPSRADYPVQGIDVSHHQGVIDWRMLRDEGVDFAYIKATEGGDHVDRLFARNWRDSGAAGIRRGAYHYFTLCRPGRDQAANLLRTMPVDPAALPVAVDLEFLGNCRTRSRRWSVDELHRELRDFLGAVEGRTGKPVLLYLTEEFDDVYEVSRRVDRPLWLRSLFRAPNFGSRDWTLWQAHNYRRVRGIGRPVDWNAARPCVADRAVTRGFCLS